MKGGRFTLLTLTWRRWTRRRYRRPSLRRARAGPRVSTLPWCRTSSVPTSAILSSYQSGSRAASSGRLRIGCGFFFCFFCQKELEVIRPVVHFRCFWCPSAVRTPVPANLGCSLCSSRASAIFYQSSRQECFDLNRVSAAAGGVCGARPAPPVRRHRSSLPPGTASGQDSCFPSSHQPFLSSATINCCTGSPYHRRDAAYQRWVASSRLVPGGYRRVESTGSERTLKAVSDGLYSGARAAAGCRCCACSMPHA